MSGHIDNKKKDISGFGLYDIKYHMISGLYDITIAAKIKYSVNFTRSGRTSSLHYNWCNSFFCLLKVLMQECVSSKQKTVK